MEWSIAKQGKLLVRRSIVSLCVPVPAFAFSPRSLVTGDVTERLIIQSMPTAQEDNLIADGSKWSMESGSMERWSPSRWAVLAVWCHASEIIGALSGWLAGAVVSPHVSESSYTCSVNTELIQILPALLLCYDGACRRTRWVIDLKSLAIQPKYHAALRRISCACESVDAQSPEYG